MTINKKIAAFASGLALASSLGLAKIVKAEEFNPNGWPIPDVMTAQSFGEKRKTNFLIGIPNKVIIQGIYQAPDGTYFNTLITMVNGKEKTFGFYVDTDGKSPMEYTLMDLDGDDVFRYKYAGNERTPVPKYISNDEQSKK